MFEFGLEISQERRGRRHMLKPVDVAFDDVATQWQSPLNTVDELPMNQFRRFVVISSSEIMPKVVHGVEGE